MKTTEQKRAHFAQVREAQVVLSKVNRELAATRDTAERIRQKYGRDSEHLLHDIEAIEHHLVKLRDQLEAMSSASLSWTRNEPTSHGHKIILKALRESGTNV